MSPYTAVVHSSASAFRKTQSRIREILLGSGNDWAELQLSMIMMTWGVWLMFLHPFGTTAQVLYVAMSAQASDTVWGVGFVLLGLATFVSLIANQTRARRVATMLDFAWWFYILLLYAMVNATVLAVPVSAILAATAAWCHVRVSAFHR